MIAAYIKAKSVSEALEALEHNKPWGRVLAGGTDIISKNRATRYKKTKDLVLIDIKPIEELHGIQIDGDNLIIGPNTTLSELTRNSLVQSAAPVLIQAASHVGSTELRNRATVGGNICTRNPSADLLIPLLAMDAQIEISDINDKTKLSMKDLLTGGLKGSGRRSLITAVTVPVRPLINYGYRRWSRESMGRAYVCVMTGLERIEAMGNFKLKFVVGGASLWPRSLVTTVPEEMILKHEERKLMIEELVTNNLGFQIKDDNYRFHLTEALIYEALDAAIKGVHA